jgi:multidrug resistance efflux pump
MGATQTQLSSQQLLWQQYRGAFHQFRREADRLAQINSQAIHDAAETENALLSVEHARLAYNQLRDELAASMMPLGLSRQFWSIPITARRRQARVKSIAELFWELAGKPQGSADDDWYRAERVLRHVETAGCCAR